MGHREQPKIVERELQTGLIANPLINRLALLVESSRVAVPSFCERDNAEHVNGVPHAHFLTRRGVQVQQARAILREWNGYDPSAPELEELDAELERRLGEAGVR